MPRLLLALALAAPVLAHADPTLTIKNHQFSPATLVVPSNTKITLTVHNASAHAAEFESSDLNREEIVAPGGEIHVIIGPLSAGTYTFFDDFHPGTTGRIEVK